jgi:thiol-disulfide isomerase/thioredoxin
METAHWETKYLKYKNKYLELKKVYNAKKLNMTGGSAIKNKLYLFKADWCGHCKHFKPTWEKLQKEMKDQVEFITYDADTHKKEIQQYAIQGFPTLVLKTDNKAIEYNGERDIESLKEFIQIYQS